MNEYDLKITKTWCAACVLVVMLIGVITLMCNKQNRDLEAQMAEHGYVQQSVAGQSGVYWVKP